jgi:NodT family efflux transporter outer membrane factor (OMF) lipoprotein
MNRHATLPAALVALVLPACAFVPHHAPRAAPISAAALGLAAEPAPAVAERWWQAFGDPRLDALVTQATHDNPTLADALGRLERARADALAAQSVRAPRLDASAAAIRERFSDRYVIPPPYGGGSYWDGQIDLNLSYDLDFWGRQSARIRAAERHAQARELDARAAALAIQSALVTTYIDLDRRHAVADIALAGAAVHEQLAALTLRRVGAGLDSAIELRNADAALPEARADREQAAAAVELAVHRLAALAGRGAAGYADIGRPQLVYGGALALPAVVPGDLLMRRPDVQAALARVEAATAAADAARLAAYPEINLRAFAGFAALTLTDLLSAPARTYGLGPAIQLPIFDAGLLRARYRGAGADLESAIAQYNATVLEAVRDVADEITTIDALDRELADADQRLGLLVDARRLAEERYQRGLANRIAVLEAEARVLAARRTLVNTRALAAQARVALVVALGGGAQPALAVSPVSTKAIP